MGLGKMGFGKKVVEELAEGLAGSPVENQNEVQGWGLRQQVRSALFMMIRRTIVLTPTIFHEDDEDFVSILIIKTI